MTAILLSTIAALWLLGGACAVMWASDITPGKANPAGLALLFFVWPFIAIYGLVHGLILGIGDHFKLTRNPTPTEGN